MTSKTGQILIGAYRDLCDLRGQRPTPGNTAGLNAAIQRAATGNEIPCNAARWLGRTPTNADRIAISRAYIALEAAGHAARVGTGHAERRHKTTALALTPAGIELARHLIRSAEGASGVEPVAVEPSAFVEPIAVEPIAEGAPVALVAEPWPVAPSAFADPVAVGLGASGVEAKPAATVADPRDVEIYAALADALEAIAEIETLGAKPTRTAAPVAVAPRSEPAIVEAPPVAVEPEADEATADEAKPVEAKPAAKPMSDDAFLLYVLEREADGETVYADDVPISRRHLARLSEQGLLRITNPDGELTVETTAAGADRAIQLASA
ncbi:hypothetical protein I41_32330 [Lacipirellula limnantheis]|uniref:Uncharacterized protein n=1 Tax=Lacipirellula limnantheis TaxID=2528024 RepID=A0A517U074_9BACT|nr:hypothetical protein I41_32330 [Lacipirellula limnantheis]